jgi:predicted 2-oxoglutarate/Fe(II)-dependent dioxygenase YbiX
MTETKFTDYNILAREDGSTSYVVVGMQKLFQHIENSKVFDERFDSLDHVANVIMETIQENRAPKVHSTLVAYSKTEEKPEYSGGRLLKKAKVSKEVVEHLPGKLRTYMNDRLPGSNVTTLEENGTIVGYRTINQELPYLLSILNQALQARKRGETFDAVQQRLMREAEPPISY